jgi:hypothetical protein
MTKAEARWSSTDSGIHVVGGYSVDIAYEYAYAGRTYASVRYAPWRTAGTEWLLQSTKQDKIQAMLQEFAPGTRKIAFISPRRPEQAFLFREWHGNAVYPTFRTEALILVNIHL